MKMRFHTLSCLLLVSSISCIASISIDVPDVTFEVVVPEDDVSKHHIQTVPSIIWDGTILVRILFPWSNGEWYQ